MRFRRYASRMKRELADDMLAGADVSASVPLRSVSVSETPASGGTLSPMTTVPTEAGDYGLRHPARGVRGSARSSRA
jgi:hypothetical protein